MLDVLELAVRVSHAALRLYFEPSGARLGTPLTRLSMIESVLEAWKKRVKVLAGIKAVDPVFGPSGGGDNSSEDDADRPALPVVNPSSERMFALFPEFSNEERPIATSIHNTIVDVWYIRARVDMNQFKIVHSFFVALSLTDKNTSFDLVSRVLAATTALHTREYVVDTMDVDIGMTKEDADFDDDVGIDDDDDDDPSKKVATCRGYAPIRTAEETEENERNRTVPDVAKKEVLAKNYTNVLKIMKGSYDQLRALMSARLNPEDKDAIAIATEGAGSLLKMADVVFNNIHMPENIKSIAEIVLADPKTSPYSINMALMLLKVAGKHVYRKFIDGFTVKKLGERGTAVISESFILSRLFTNISYIRTITYTLQADELVRKEGESDSELRKRRISNAIGELKSKRTAALEDFKTRKLSSLRIGNGLASLRVSAYDTASDLHNTAMEAIEINHMESFISADSIDSDGGLPNVHNIMKTIPESKKWPDNKTLDRNLVVGDKKAPIGAQIYTLVVNASFSGVPSQSAIENAVARDVLTIDHAAMLYLGLAKNL
jgi:hypothetical protein